MPVLRYHLDKTRLMGYQVIPRKINLKKKIKRLDHTSGNIGYLYKKK